MRLTWLGWAGVELEVDGTTLVIDPLEDAAAVFAWGGEAATQKVPEVAPPSEGRAVAGLVTHLHRDHADAGALTRALADGGNVFEPKRAEDLALAQANKELSVAGLARRPLNVWDRATAGPFTITALPAMDGIGDPQVSWLVEAQGTKVVHCGDTIWHSHWWRIAQAHGPFDAVLLPVNGAKLNFPHRQPPSDQPGALTPDQAANAAEILGAKLAIPIHAEGYEVPGVYEPLADAAARFIEAANRRGITATQLAVGGSLEA